MEPSLAVTVGNYAAHFATVGILLFTLGYAIFAPWWRSPLGRNMMTLAFVHLVTFSLISVQLVWGISWAGRGWVRAGIFAGIALVYWHRWYVLLVDQIIWPRGHTGLLGAPGPETGATHKACTKCGK
jgi:hypothetical protein